jgi:hypothetical protein
MDQGGLGDVGDGDTGEMADDADIGVGVAQNQLVDKCRGRWLRLFCPRHQGLLAGFTADGQHREAARQQVMSCSSKKPKFYLFITGGS